MNGVQGFRGTQGFGGVQGLGGDNGVQGFVGAQGFGGANGVQGAVGAQGAVGVQGAVGSQGLQGQSGLGGSQGAMGSQGSQGSQGLGAQGLNGVQGAQGKFGSQGLQGPIGNQGASGQGVPVGGTTGQVLSKIDSSNYNTQWVTPSSGMSGAPYYKIAISYNTGSTSVYTYSSFTSSGFSNNFTVGQSGTGAASIITITNTVSSASGGLTGALQIMPTSAYICYATAATAWSNWDASPTFGYKSISASIITEVTTSVTPTLNIITPFTSSGLAGSGLINLLGDNSTRVLAYIFLQFNTSIL